MTDAAAAASRARRPPATTPTDAPSSPFPHTRWRILAEWGQCCSSQVPPRQPQRAPRAHRVGRVSPSTHHCYLGAERHGKGQLGVNTTFSAH